MARTRPRPKVAESSDENQRSLRELVVFLEDRPAFRLGLAIYDVPRTREAWLDRLAAALTDRPVHLLRLDLSHEPNEALLLRRLEDVLRTADLPEGKTPAVMVTGLEAAIDFRPMPGTLFVEGGQLLRNANLQRDAFTERCPVPVVLWLNGAGATALTQTAPDLMQWCTGMFQFAGGESARKDLEKGLLSSPLSETDRGYREVKRERIALLQDLLLELERSPQADPGSISRRAALHYELGQVFLALSDATAAKHHFQITLNLARQTADRDLEGCCLEGLGSVELAFGHIGQAIALFEQSLELAQLVGHKGGLSASLGNLGVAYAQGGDLDRALEYFRRELEMLSQVGDMRSVGQTLNNIGALLARLKRHDEALPILEQALEIARESNDLLSIGADLNNLGPIYMLRGDTSKGLACLEEALAVAQQLGNRSLESRALSNQGWLRVQLGQPEQAIKMLERAVRIARDIEEPEVIESAEWNLRLAREAEPKRLDSTIA